ncbi:MAG: amidohydrolase, partial [Pseudonocardia sp.]
MVAAPVHHHEPSWQRMPSTAEPVQQGNPMRPSAIPHLVIAFALAALPGLAAAAPATPAASPLEAEVRTRTAALVEQLIGWRRDIHQHPELGDQETRTAALVAKHLEGLGLEVQTGVARTGVVGILRGGKPGPVVALRADMDALPVTEPAGLPFASTARQVYQGQVTGVMHACGHDAHTAMLMAVAQVLSAMKAELPGTVMFIFQPAEEGPSDLPLTPEATWGARMMLEEGLFERLKPDAVFAVHVMPGKPGTIYWRAGATTASSDTLSVTIHGKQGHGGMPWDTIDPIVTSGLVLAGLQTVVSRRADLTTSPAVVTIGSIHGGTGPNIVPDAVEMAGTIRTYDEQVRKRVGDDARLAITRIAESTGASAEVVI